MQKETWISNGIWMYVERNPKKNWSRVEVERKIEQGGGCQASEKVRIMIGRAELPAAERYATEAKKAAPFFTPTSALSSWLKYKTFKMVSEVVENKKKKHTWLKTQRLEPPPHLLLLS